ncbi:hypothetical protein [Amycolatopsis dendrobii]|uniref:Uncharacterized protein n=1 Tax=Amycolatopsis dendrobii TaxID=2760662 RepID=A0A7W3W372_9PSEU|nr:hypothetical protein [Amycolatopsis dendrobii]MBB1157955.1 hypothetical protein [Amycolatopsis dendrobii]
MRWPFRKKPPPLSSPEPDPVPLPPQAGTFLCLVQVGDDESGRMVSSEVLDRLVRATKDPALETLDEHFGAEEWCFRIRTTASREGPGACFALDVAIPPGETAAGMSDLISDEFVRRWQAALARYLP